MNLEDLPSTAADDQHEISMSRYSLYLETDADLRDYQLGQWKIIARGDRETMTDYLERLDNSTTTDLRDFYNMEEIRELYVDYELTENIALRLGKQIVTWGESGVLRGLDVINGSNFAWGSAVTNLQDAFKPLPMANVEVEVPTWDGSLQLLYIPPAGIAEPIQFITERDGKATRGGRWAARFSKGSNRLDLIPYNFFHPEGNFGRQAEWGLRWSGRLDLPLESIQTLDYSLNYLQHHFKEVPTAIPDAAGIAAGVPSDFAPAESGGPLGGNEFIFPEIDIYGFSANAYIVPLDFVTRVEVAYKQDRPFNTAPQPVPPFSPPPGGCVGPACIGPAGTADLQFGALKKDVVKSLIAVDSVVYWPQWLFFSERPGTLSIALSDLYIRDFRDAEQLTTFQGFADEHNASYSVRLTWNYQNSTINPVVLLVQDLSHGKGGIVVPSVQIVYGTNWRINVGGLFQFGGKTIRAQGSPGQDIANPLDGLKDNDQLMFIFTYQF